MSTCKSAAMLLAALESFGNKIVGRRRIAGAALAIAAALGGQAWAAGVTTELVSVGPNGLLPNGLGTYSSISADGRFVAFESDASNLVPGDTNGEQDIFVHDRQTNTTSRVSVRYCQPRNFLCVQANGESELPRISADGRYVAFNSKASNLASGDTNGASDVFVRDRQTNVTTRVSVGKSGVQGNGDSDWASLSADGRYVAFESYASNLVPGDTNGRSDVFVRDRWTGITSLVNWRCLGVPSCIQADQDSFLPSLSANGRFVTFISNADNLVPGIPTNVARVFIVDRKTLSLERADVGPGGAQANGWAYIARLSADERFVVFASEASNLVVGDTNGEIDSFVRDRKTGTTVRVSVSTKGAQGNSGSQYPSITADGRYVTFQSYATNLVAGDTNQWIDIFVRDLVLGTTTRASVSQFGTQANDGDSFFADISADGHFVSFLSYATDLVYQGGFGIFVHKLIP